MIHTPLPQRYLYSHSLYSAHLEEERTVKIFLPIETSADTPLPILYCQDGIEFFMYGRIATIAKKMIEGGLIPPILIAGVSKNAKNRSQEYHPEGIKNQNYTHFFIKELIPFVEKEYSPYLSSQNTPIRHLAGVSLGATVSLQMSLLYEGFFQRLMLFSGAFYKSLLPLLQSHAPLSFLSLYMVVGEDETQVDTPLGTYNFLDENISFHEVLQSLHDGTELHILPGNHTWGFWQTEMERALLWLFHSKTR